MADISQRDQDRVTTLLAVRSDTFLSTVTLAADPNTHELLVKGSFSFTPSGTQDVNIVKVNGSVANLAQETGGNLATIATNTTPLVTSGGGGYIRQDSTATIAKESGGNLASIKTNTDTMAAWDGSGRANVSIAAVGAVDTNSGVVSTRTLRVTLATDVTLPAITSISAFASNTTPNTAPSSASLVAAVYNSTEISPTNTQSFALQADSKGRLRQVIMDAAGNTRGANVNASNQLSVTVDNSNVSTNIAQMNGVTVTMGNGISGTGVQRVTLASDSTGQVALAAGTAVVGQVNVAPQTANGLTVFNATSSDGATALTNTAQAIKASAGNLYGWYIYNPNSSAQFVQLYNVAAGSVTVGTTNPLFMLTIPATSAANVEFTNGITFSNAGWSASATSTAGGNGAPSTALDAVFFYK